jgi:hypothetical protein
VTILRSYRWRRRLVVATIMLLIAGPLIFLGVHFSTPGNPGNASGPEVPGYAEPKRAPFTAEKQRAVRSVLRDFIGTAVVRHDVGRSWDLAAPSLKQGLTRKQWTRGELPVVPYPAANKGWGTWDFVQYSYQKAVGLEVLLFPRPGSGYSTMTADVELVQGPDRRWRVDYWMPKKFHGPPAVTAKGPGKEKRATAPGGKHRRAPNAPSRRAAPAAIEAPRASHLWWLLPIGLLSLIVVLPISIGLVAWYRNRKAEREYLRTAANRSKS